ncbi:MAG: ATP-binding protein [Bacteroidetes bacterium]|nr:ATP-binding protein [Bacteroidota bacterium]
MHRPESISYNAEKVRRLHQMVRQGEGLHLEFKRKASFPDKIAREIIAFANTDGGTLLIGVDDDGSIPGVKYPEEESLAIRLALRKHCRPGVVFHENIYPVTEKKFVLEWTIPQSRNRPHFFVTDGKKTAFVRRKDQSITASTEMCEVIRRSKSSKGTHLQYGVAEESIVHYLHKHHSASLGDIIEATGLKLPVASHKVVKLVLAGILTLSPSEKGDVFALA